MIAAHLTRLESQLDQTQAAVASLRNLLAQTDAATDIAHRSIPDTLTAAITDTIDLDELAPWWRAALGELDAVVSSLGVERVGPRGGLYGTDLFLDERGEATVFIPVAVEVPPSGRVQSLTIPATEVAVATHPGPHDEIDRTYGALGTYVSHHALGVEGPVRESYLVSEFDHSPSSEWRTEIFWPIFRTAHR
jgi:effector-binding domain-containing protein